MSDNPTIKLLNTSKKLPVTVYAFDNDSVTLPANQTEALPVDAKFGWNLPKGVKNVTPVQKTEEAPVVQVEPDPVMNHPPETPVTPLTP